MQVKQYRERQLRQVLEEITSAGLCHWAEALLLRAMGFAWLLLWVGGC